MTTTLMDVAPDQSAWTVSTRQPSPGVVWKTLSAGMVAPDRRRSVKVMGESGKYRRWPVPLQAKLPSQPTAALLFDHDGRTRWLGIDLDPATAGSEATLAAGADAASLLIRAGFRPIVDRSPRGGVHVWARLARAEPVQIVGPLLRAFKSWMAERHPGVQLDLAPMFNPKQGCLSLPASPCRGGGHRELVTPLSAAVQALDGPVSSGALERLAAELDVGLGQFDFTPPLISTNSDDEPVVPSASGPRPLKAAALEYLTRGDLGNYAGRSEARRAAILHVVWQSWTFAGLRENVENGTFRGLADDVNRPSKRGLRYLEQEWNRAAEAVRKALAERAENTAEHEFRDSAHTYSFLHGGVPRGPGGNSHWTHRWLQSAERWARQNYQGSRFLTVAAVLHGIAWLALLQSDSESDRLRVAELPVRSLRLVTGLIGIETIAEVLRDLQDAVGSPVLLIESGAGTARGSRYYLRQIAPTDDEFSQVKPHLGALAPVWAVLGLAPWRVYNVLERSGRQSTAAELVELSGLGKSTVYDALRQLREHGLVEPGVIALGATSVVDVGQAVGADQLYADALQRIRVEREQWKKLLASWQDAATVRFVAPEDVPGPAERDDIDDLTVVEALGPVPWDLLLDREPPEDPYARTTVEDLVLDLLEDMLGAVALGPEQPAELQAMEAFERGSPVRSDHSV